MFILGISAYYHDSAAALVKDGVVIAAAAEERFNRKKHYKGFPTLACQFCLAYASIKIEDVDRIVFYEKPFRKFERIIRTHINYSPYGIKSFLSAMPIWLKERLNMRGTIKKEIGKTFNYIPTNIFFCQHHFSHAALAYYTSPFKKCSILVVDAVGENATTSIIKASKEGFETVEYQQFPHSLGLLYSSFTYYLGFQVNSDEYKVMGLAPYGNRDSDDYNKYKDTIIHYLVKIQDDGCIRLNDKLFAFTYDTRMVDDRKWADLFGIPKREPHDPIKACHQNLALAIQDITEEIILKMADYARRLTGIEDLCVVGGCSLNCVAIGKLLGKSKAGSIYVPFAPGDDGAAIGCALYMSHSHTEGNNVPQSPYLGPSYSDRDVKNALDDANIKYEYVSEINKLYSIVSNELAKGKIVGWFQGKMEFGPRALGNRSILADPRNPKMKEEINSRVKFRESFRPFAPSVLEDFVGEFFEIEDFSPYMAATFKIKSDVMDLPAITHLDKTARIQTVSPNLNEKFYGLLNAFYKETACPILLNTSFNVMGEPIVCTPNDAIKTFIASGIDVLVLNHFIVRKI